MRIYAESPKTRRFWDARFEDGIVTVREGPLQSDADTERAVECAADEAQARMEALLVARFADGFMSKTPPEQRWTPEAHVAEWFAADGLPSAVDPDPSVPAAFSEAHGRGLPGELQRFLAWRGDPASHAVDFGEWRMDPGDTWCPAAADGNRFEQLILRDQDNYLGTHLLEYFTGCVPIGQAGNGDVYFAHLDAFDPDRAEIILWNHETRQPEKAVADGISTLAWINRSYQAVETHDFDPDSLTDDLERVADRASLTWHYGDLVSESGVEPEYARRTNAIYYFYRMIWVIRLLQSDGVRGFNELPDLFYEQIHGPQRFEAAVSGPYLTFGTVTALYWLWRLFWFDKADDLARCLEIVADHPSPVVRDAAALVAELQAGRTTLGRIEDVHALRARFIALDLDPERAEARAAEAAAAEAAAAAKTAADIARAEAAVVGLDATALAELAWAEIDNPDALAIVKAALRPHHPDAFVRVDFLERNGSSRNNRAYGFENDEIFEHLPTTAPWLAPFWIAERGARGFVPAARTGDPRVRARVEPVLAEREEHHHRVVAAIEALTILGAADLVPRFVAMLPEFLWEGRDFIAAIRNKRVVWALCAAIGALGDARHAAPLVGLAQDGPADVVVRALKALGALGGPAAVDALEAALDGPHRRVAVHALSQADPARAVVVLEAALAREFGEPSALVYERLMLEAARQATGLAPDLAVVDGAFATIEALKYEDIELHETLSRLAPSLNARPDLLRAQAVHPRAEVRATARAALPPGVRYADRAAVETLFEIAGLAGLTEWLRAPDVVFKYQLVRRAAEEAAVDDAFAAATVEWFEAEFGRFTAYTHGFVRDDNRTAKAAVHALIDLGHPLTDALVTRLLGGSNAMYRQFVRKYDRDKRFSAPAAEPTDALSLDFEEVGDALWAYGGSINGLAWSPDGSRLAVAGAGGVALFDAAGAEVLRFASTRNGWIYDVAWHPSGAYLAMGAHAGHLHLLDPTDGRLIARLEGHAGVPNGVRKLRFSPDGTRLASVSCDRTLRVWAVGDGMPETPVECVAVHCDTADVNGVDWLDDERVVIITDNALHWLAVGEAPFASVHRAGGAEVRVIDGAVLASTSAGIRVFDDRGVEDPVRVMRQQNVARIVPFDGGLLAASWDGADTGVSIWQAGAQRRLEGHDGAVFGAAIQPGTGRLFAGGKLNRVARWSPDGTPEPEGRAAHANEISDVAFVDDRIYTASDDGSVIEWSAAGAALRRFRPSTGGRCCAVAVEGDTLVTSGSAQVAAFDLVSGDERWALKLGRSEVMDIFGDVVVAADYKSLTWIDLRSGERLHTSAPFSRSFMFRYARLDGGRFVCAGYDDPHLYVWDAAERRCVDTWTLPPTAEKGKICGLARGGDRLFVTRWDKTMVVLDAATGRVDARVHLPYSLLNPAADATGSRVVLGEANCLVYSTTDYRCVGRFTPPAKLSRTVFAPDARLLLGAASGALFRATLP